MHKNVTKLLKILLIIIVFMATGFVIIIIWILGPSIQRSTITRILEDEGSEVSLLVNCKEMLTAENAWNPTISYNYVYYFKNGHCPSPDKLKNVEHIQKEFCNRVLEKSPSLHNSYVNREKICPDNEN